MEQWKDIEGYEGFYQVSNCGRVKSLARETNAVIQMNTEDRIKKASQKGKDGYLTVQLYKNNTAKSVYVHRLVAESFIPNPLKKKTVNHKNGNKQDNRVENLEWMTYKENNKHAYDTGLNDEKHRRNNRTSIAVRQLDVQGNLISEYPSMREAERQTGVTVSEISLGIKKGWNYRGFTWEYAQ